MVNVNPEKRGNLNNFLELLNQESIFESIEQFKIKIEKEIGLNVFLKKYKKIIKNDKKENFQEKEKEIKILIELENENYIN